MCNAAISFYFVKISSNQRLNYDITIEKCDKNWPKLYFLQMHIGAREQQPSLQSIFHSYVLARG